MYYGYREMHTALSRINLLWGFTKTNMLKMF